MYGLVNRAVEGLVRSEFGDEIWLRIKAGAGVDLEYFVGMESYPDAVTYRLVASASEVLKVPAEQVLELFGEYWVLYTAREGYGDLLTMAGDNLQDFLLNLDNLHARVGATLTRLLPPTFVCTDVEPGSLVLHYYSSREGLAPMVVGLLRGLGKLMNTRVEVTHLRRRVDGADHDEFLVRHGR